MKRESLITKLVAFMLCVMMVVGCLPVSAYAANDWEGDIDVVETEPPVGSQQNPATVEWVWNEAYTEATATVTVPANSTMYFQDRSISADNVLTANGDTVEVTYGIPRMTPSTWNIANTTEADVEYTLVLSYAVGSMQNPQAIDYFDAQTVSIEAGDQDGYYFIYTADCTGKVKISVDSAVGWTYTIENLTSGVYGSAQYSDADSVVDTFDVAADDEIRIIVNTFNPDDQWNPPAGDVTVSLEKLTGYCPVCATPLYPDMTVSNAGTVYYQGRFGGQIVTFTGDCDFTVSLDGAEAVASSDGKVELTVPVAAGFPQPANSIVITGDGNITVTTAYPAGHMENPAVAVLGDNVANIAAGSQGYFWTYTAEKAGDLVFNFSSSDGNWTYTINNMTTYVYGDKQWSDSDPVVNPATAEHTLEDPCNGGYCQECWNEIAGTGHNYVNGTCSVCGESEGPEVDETLVFRQIGLSFAEIIGVEPLVMNSVVKNYDTYYIKAVVETPDGPVESIINVEDAVIVHSLYKSYRLEMVPKTMTDKITFTIYAEKDGVTFCSNPVETSITALAIDKIKANEATDENACKVLANLLQYGAEAQKAFTYRTDDLASDYLGDYAKFCTDITDSELVPTANIVTEGSGIRVYANSLSLGSTVTVEFLFKQNTVPAGSEMRFVMNGETHTISVDEFDAEFLASYYLVQFSLKPRNFRDTITMAMYDANGNAISAVYTASVADYAANVVNKYPTLVPAMLAYGDSVLVRFPG